MLGGLSSWAEGMAHAGVQVSPRPVGESVPDLVVAPGALAAEAVKMRAGMVLVEGSDARAVMRSAGLHAPRYLVRPNIVEPNFLLSLEQRRAGRYAAEH